MFVCICVSFSSTDFWSSKAACKGDHVIDAGFTHAVMAWGVPSF